MDELERLSQGIIEFYEKISSWEHAVVRDSGLSPAQMHAIEIIGHEQELRMKELAEKMGVTTGTLTVMVDRLERLGLVARRPHASDRRSYLVVLTDKGRRHFRQHQQLHIGLTREIVAGLSSEEVAAFSRILTTLLARV